MTKSRGINRPRVRWKPADDVLLRALYPDQPKAVLMERLGRPILNIYRRAHLLGLKRSAAYMASPHACRLRRGDHVGAPYRYAKGHVPANKGKRSPGYAPGRMAETQFRKGQVSQTWRPIGTEVVDRDGYLKRKISDDRALASRFNWRFVHRLVWEQHNGPIPAKHVVAFRNGNKADVRIENLELVSRVEWARRHRMHNLYPPEVTQLIRARAGLARSITCKERKLNEKQKLGPTRSPVRDDRAAQGRKEPGAGQA